jgi:tellurite resistance protein
MHLSNRIAESGLSDAVARTFADGLKQVALADGPENDVERQLISRLVDVLWTSSSDPAPFEALWSCAELFLTACVYVAVADGEYAVEEARRISLFAHRLGYSARRLSELESRVFVELRERGELAKLRHTTRQRVLPEHIVDLKLPPPLPRHRSRNITVLTKHNEEITGRVQLDDDITEPLIEPVVVPRD